MSTSSKNQGNQTIITIVLGATIGPFIHIKPDGTATGANEVPFAVTLDGGVSGDRVRAALVAGGGTITMTAGAACTANALVYGAANGKITGTSSSNTTRGYALEAASADGDRIEVAPISG